MNTPECRREQEVIEAALTGQWPGLTDPDLRSHVETCAICKDVVAVAHALNQDNRLLSDRTQLPSAGLVWWRSELRARREAMRAAERPLKLVHAFGAACGLGVLAALVMQLSPWARQMFATIAGLSFSETATALMHQHLPVVLGLGVLLVLAPVALYFVFSDK
jgi:predicted anti-sigma-YlaC factor YlaD